ncbi:MAG: UbiA family prenyltransferase [Gemmatimonadaceae bacterium]
MSLGAWWSRGGGLTRVALAAVAAVALTSAANAWNDADDVAIDRVAHPARPLPSGALSVAAARRIAIACALAGVALSAAARPVLGAVSVAAVAIIWVYSSQLKQRGLPGNVVVAVLASAPFLYGAWAADRPRAGIVLLVLAAPLHLAREIAKDLDDVAGDRGARRTLPEQIGPAMARWGVALSVLTFLCLLGPRMLRAPHFALALVPAILLCGLATARVLRARSGGPTLFKIAMLFAMAAFAGLRA